MAFSPVGSSVVAHASDQFVKQYSVVEKITESGNILAIISV